MKSSGPSGTPTSRDDERGEKKEPGEKAGKGDAADRPGAGKLDKGRLLDELEVMHKLGHLRPVNGGDREAKP